MAVATQQRQLLPFRMGTRQRFTPVAVVNVSDNARQSVILPRVGFLSHIVAQIDATVTNTPGTGSIGTAALGPWNLLRRATVRVNLGTAVIYSTSGWSNYVLQLLMKERNDLQAIGDSDLYAFSTASGDQTLRLTYLIPVAANFGEDFSVGLLNLQAPELQCNLDLEFGQLVGDCYTVSGGATVAYKTGTQPVCRVGYLFYEVPDPNRVLYPPLAFHRVLEDEQPLSSGGDQVYTVPREGVVLRLFHTFLSNTPARSNEVSSFVLRANKTDEIYRLDRWAQKLLQAYRYSQALPVGVFCWDFWASKAAGEPGWGDTRDAWNTEAVSTTEVIFTLSSAFTPGANAKAIHVREILQYVSL